MGEIKEKIKIIFENNWFVKSWIVDKEEIEKTLIPYRKQRNLVERADSETVLINQDYNNLTVVVCRKLLHKYKQLKLEFRVFRSFALTTFMLFLFMILFFFQVSSLNVFNDHIAKIKKQDQVLFDNNTKINDSDRTDTGQADRIN